MSTINELAATAGEMNHAMNVQANLDPHSSVVVALASGFDVALTIMEQATGARFNAIASQSAMRVVQYFQDESVRNQNAEPQIAIWYRAWAQLFSTKFLTSNKP